MPLFKGQQGMSLVAVATFYLPHVIFFFYKIGQSLFSPATKLFLYDSVCRDRYDELAIVYANEHDNRNNNISHHQNLTTGDDDANFSQRHHFDCQNLSGQAENLVQQSAANYIMAMKILQDVPAFILGMYCGGWIDRIGRRLPMMLSCIGGALVALLFAIIQIAGSMAIPGIFIGITINSMTGRNTLVTMAIQAYVSDQTVEKERTRQLGYILAMNFFGLFTGSLMMGLMADLLPFWAMFLCVAVFYSTCFVLIFCVLPEKPLPLPSANKSGGVTIVVTDISNNVASVSDNHHHQSHFSSSKHDGNNIKEPPTNVIIGAPQTPPPSPAELLPSPPPEEMNFALKMVQCCRLANFTDTIKTITRKRPNDMRRYLILTYLCIILQNMCKAGEIDVLLLFVKHTPLNWSKAWYAYLLSSQYATVAILLLLLLPFLLKKLRLSDSSIIICSIIAKTIGVTLMAFSDRSWMVFLASVFISTFGMIISCLRSTVSKIVEESEIGKCFAIISSSETVSDLVGVVVFIRLYHVGLIFGEMGRSLPFLTIAVIHLFILGVAIYIKIGMDRSLKRVGVTNNNLSRSNSNNTTVATSPSIIPSSRIISNNNNSALDPATLNSMS